jgi:hypothetical protein
VPEPGDGHDEAGQHLDALGVLSDLGFDAGRREQDVDDDTAAATLEKERGAAFSRPGPVRPRWFRASA